MNLLWFHYNVVKLFSDNHYTNVFMEHHLKELRDFGNNAKGWIAVMEKEKYIIPEFIHGKELRTVLPLRVTNFTIHKQQTIVYKVATGIQPYSIPSKRMFSFREWVDLFAPFNHSAPKQFLLYKIIVLGALISRYNFRIASNPAFGKDSLPTILSQLLPMEVCVYFPRTNARLMQMVERRLLMITELPDATKKDLSVLEPVIRIVGDGRPTLVNNAIAMPGMTKEAYDISELSMGFIYNEIQDYRPPHVREDRSEHYFDSHMTLATQQRFLPLHFHGTLYKQQFPHLKKQETEHHFSQAHEFLKEWCMTANYYIHQPPMLSGERLLWKTQIPMIGDGKGRLQAHLESIIWMIRTYAQSQEEFSELCIELYTAYQRYYSMIAPIDENKPPQVDIEDLSTYS